MTSIDRHAIEREARALQARVWRSMSESAQVASERTVWGMLEAVGPRQIATALGINYSEEPTLRSPFPYRDDYFEPAGILDRQANQIWVSKSFAVDTVRFTAAHEVGHWVLHKDAVHHRDRPIPGLLAPHIPRSKEEREADHFAACVLMPHRMVRYYFEQNFGEEPFRLDERAAFELDRKNPHALLRAGSDSLERELALAKAKTFNGIPITSLVEIFRVSPASMAIRIRELGLLSD